MFRKLLVSGMASIILASILFLVDLTEISMKIGAGNMQVYPAAFFALISLFLFYRAYKIRALY